MYFCISGLSHNIPLLRDIMTETNFVSGNISTKYLNQVYPEGFKGKYYSVFSSTICCVLTIFTFNLMVYLSIKYFKHIVCIFMLFFTKIFIS